LKQKAYKMTRRRRFPGLHCSRCGLWTGSAPQRY